MKHGGSHSFANAPKALVARKKYRDDSTEGENSVQIHNIHNDHRVFRGNTYANLKEQFETHHQDTSKSLRRKRKEVPSLFDLPLPAPLREPVDLSYHLEEQNVHIPECVEIDAQTNSFSPKIPDPPYVPQKRGLDVATMVEDGDLLVGFDQLVTPLIDTLVYKTLDQALLEVNEEEQVAQFQEFRRQWRERRAEDRDDWQKYVSQEIARYEETRALMEKFRAKKAKQADITKKMTAFSLSRTYLNNLMSSALHTLTNCDCFSNPEQDAASEFVSYVTALAASRIPSENALPKLLDDIVSSVVHSQRDRRRKGREDLAARREQARIDIEEKRIAALTRSVTVTVTESEEGEEGPVVKELTLTFRIDEDFSCIKDRMLRMLKDEAVKTDVTLGIDFVSGETILEDPEALANAESILIRQSTPTPEE